jgi:hypothetical protein
MPLLSIVRPGEGYTEERIYGRDKALLAILNGSGREVADVPIARKDDMAHQTGVAKYPTAGMPILGPVSGQVGLRFLGKAISGCRDRTAITSVEAECENPETKSTGREGANTWVFGAAPGNLRRVATDWWSN